ncbi:hypothetical protein AB0E78_10140 [Streptomyces sp. NPDC032198]
MRPATRAVAPSRAALSMLLFVLKFVLLFVVMTRFIAQPPYCATILVKS